MKFYSNSRKIYACGSVLLGILLLLWPARALKLAAYAAGIVIMGGGITSTLSYFRNKKRPLSSGVNLVFGIVVILVGVWIFMNPEDFASIIPTAVGYLITFSGIINLLETFTLSRAHYRKWWVSLLAAVLTIMMGLVLVNHAFGIAATMVRIGGAALLFNGISDLWINKRVDQYTNIGRKGSRKSASGKSAGAGGTGTARTARYDTSDPDIIDAEDYREL